MWQIDPSRKTEIDYGRLEDVNDSFETLIRMVQRDIERLERGELRSFVKTTQGWEDRTADEIHDKRNLVATLKATLGVVVALTKE